MRTAIEKKFYTHDGTHLFYRHWPRVTEGTTERALVLFHRGHEHSGRFQDTVQQLDLPEFADGRLVPTGENLARFIHDRVATALGAAARVTRVTVAEDSTLSATYEPG